MKNRKSILQYLTLGLLFFLTNAAFAQAPSHVSRKKAERAQVERKAEVKQQRRDLKIENKETKATRKTAVKSRKETALEANRGKKQIKKKGAAKSKAQKRGNAYGKNKGTLKGKEFGKNRAAEAKSRKKLSRKKTQYN